MVDSEYPDNQELMDIEDIGRRDVRILRDLARFHADERDDERAGEIADRLSEELSRTR